MGKEGLKKSSTVLANIGSGTTAVQSLTIIRTGSAPRDGSGGNIVIKNFEDNDNQCEIGDIVKYVNICLQAGPRWITGDVPTAEDNGWIEYALIKYREGTIVPAVTNLGTKTLADICTKAFRGDCIFSGCAPIGAQQPMSLDMKIKLPKVMTKIQRGSLLVFYFWFRSVSSTDTRTDSHRVIASCLYKNYN